MSAKRTIVALALGSLAAVSLAARSATILDNSSLGYYNAGLGTSLDTLSFTGPFPCANISCGDLTLSFPAAPNLSAASGALGNWLTSSAPTGGAWSAAPIAIPGTWAVNSETAISYGINAGTGLTNLHLSIGVDNGVFVWLNGNYLFGARAPGGSVAGEYSLNLPTLTGINYLQILREDHGGGTGYDIALTGDRAIARVAEPASIGMLLMGLAGIAWSLRRQQRFPVRR